MYLFIYLFMYNSQVHSLRHANATYILGTKAGKKSLIVFFVTCLGRGTCQPVFLC